MAARKNGRGGYRVGAGRKPKPADQKQSRMVQVNLTPGEFADLERAAKGELLGTYARRVLLRHLARRRK